MEDCATIIETEAFIKVQIEIPQGYPDITVDEVEGGILVQALDGEQMHCFVPLPPSANIGEMKAAMEDGGLSILIPKSSVSSRE